MPSDCGKKGHARKGCTCDRCERVRKREREYGRQWREDKKDHVLERQRKHRARTGNAATKNYEKTRKGFLMRAYCNMQSRVEGVQKPGSWTGKELLPREGFYEWALANPEFHRLFRLYEDSGYQCSYAPSPDRVDPERGYTLDNMRWLTHSENSSLANRRAA